MKKYFAEFLGTFWLVFGGCGSAVLAAAYPKLGIGIGIGIGFAGVALAFGLTVLTMAYAVGHISGGHFTTSTLPFPSAFSLAAVSTVKTCCLTSYPKLSVRLPLRAFCI